MRLIQAGMILIAVTLVGGCANTGLRELVKPGEGPDEFLIAPGSPLQSPPDFSTLPQPNPGGANISDQRPQDAAVAALGGRPVAEGSADGAIVNHASRFGRDGSIRTQLAEEDEAFRKRRGRFTQIKIGRTDSYKEVYSRQALDAAAEERRWRRAGARTPSAPPQ